MITEKYFEGVISVLERIKNTQSDKIKAAAAMVAEVIENNGIIYAFGCGHSHLAALDCFYRSGGLANVSAMLDTDLMLHNGAAKSSRMEKMNGIAECVLDRYCITENDLLFVISTSGKNAVPVEMAEAAAKRGIRTVGIVSSEYFCDKDKMPMLFEMCDLFIDNCVPYGDAIIGLDGTDTRIGSVSTAASTFIMQSVLAEGAQKAHENGAEVSIYKSGNVRGGSEYNKKIVNRYLQRIKHL